MSPPFLSALRGLREKEAETKKFLRSYFLKSDPPEAWLNSYKN